MSAVGLGDNAFVGELKATKIVAQTKEVDELTVSGISNFENTVNLTATATLEANGSVRMADAEIFMFNLPTSDPAVAGRLWNSGGTLRVSAG